MRHCGALAWGVVVVATMFVALPPRAQGRERAHTLAELEAAALPRVDVAAMADPSYAARFTRERDVVRAKRADLILELYHASPAESGMQPLLSERWRTMVQQGKAQQAVAEMSEYLAGAGMKEKEAAAFQRAQTIIQQTAKDTAERLAAVESFKPFVSPEQSGTLIPQLLYWTARLEPQAGEKETLLSRAVSQYPESPVARVIRGATRRQEAVGKTMTARFDDAITGTPIDLEDFRGKVVVVEFWAAWCTDCAREMPHMKTVYADFRGRGVEFVGVSLDLPESDGGLAALKAAVARHQLKWPQYYLGKEWDSDFSQQWGVFSVPSVFVLGRDGRVINSDAGGKLEAVLEEALKASGPANQRPAN